MTADRAALVEKVAKALVSRDSKAKGQEDMVWKIYAEDAAAAIDLIRAETLEEAETAIVHALMPNKGAVAAASAAIRALGKP